MVGMKFSGPYEASNYITWLRYLDSIDWMGWCYFHDANKYVSRGSAIGAGLGKTVVPYNGGSAEFYPVVQGRVWHLFAFYEIPDRKTGGLFSKGPELTRGIVLIII